LLLAIAMKHVFIYYCVAQDAETSSMTLACHPRRWEFNHFECKRRRVCLLTF